MKILNLYVTKNLLTVFTGSILVMSFIMMAGQLIKMLDLLSSGIKFSSFAKLFILVLPETLALAMPIAMLVSVILVFSRMSAENEVTALRASGISLWQITAPGLILSLILSCACLYFQLNLKPNCKYFLSNAKQNLLLENPSMIIVPGSNVNIGGVSLNIGERGADDKLSKVTIVRPDSESQTTIFYGKSGFLEIDDERNIYYMHLEDVRTRIVEYTGDDQIKIRTGHQVTTVFPLNVGKLINNNRLRKKAKYLDFSGLVGRIQVLDEQGLGSSRDRNELLFQLNQGIVMALSPFAFLMVAMPFGFRSARSETSVGLVISLLVIIVYFSIVLLMKNFDKSSYAYLLIWLPNICFVSYGIYALRKITRT